MYFTYRLAINIASATLLSTALLNNSIYAQVLQPRHSQVNIKIVPIRGIPKIGLKRDDSVRSTDAQLKSAPSVEEFINRLPEWGRIYPKEDGKLGSKTGTSKITGGDGKKYDVSTTHYSITTTPDEIVAFQPVNAFWVGSMIQEKGLVEGVGSLTEVPIEAIKRPRLKITTDLLIPNNVETIENPSSSLVQVAVSNLISRAAQAKVKTGTSVSYKMTENYSEEQAALSLGLDAHYMGAAVKGALQTKNTESRHSISAVFIEKAFTVKADFEGRSGASAFFNDKFTMDNARKLVDQGVVSVNNMPAYLASVTYGRMLIFTMTANATESDIRGAIQASYEAGVAGAKVNASASNLLKNSTTEIAVTSIGGPAEASSGLIKSGKLADFFSKSAPLTSMVPISYTVNTVRENRLAAMARTTDYIATTYNASATGRTITSRCTGRPLTLTTARRTTPWSATASYVLMERSVGRFLVTVLTRTRKRRTRRFLF
jgi:Thiol-activated cytolysin